MKYRTFCSRMNKLKKEFMNTKTYINHQERLTIAGKEAKSLGKMINAKKAEIMKITNNIEVMAPDSTDEEILEIMHDENKLKDMLKVFQKHPKYLEAKEKFLESLDLEAKRLKLVENEFLDLMNNTDRFETPEYKAKMEEYQKEGLYLPRLDVPNLPILDSDCTALDLINFFEYKNYQALKTELKKLDQADYLFQLTSYNFTDEAIQVLEGGIVNLNKTILEAFKFVFKDEIYKKENFDFLVEEQKTLQKGFNEVKDNYQGKALQTRLLLIFTNLFSLADVVTMLAGLKESFMETRETYKFLYQ